MTWKIISHKKSFMFLFKKQNGDHTARDIANRLPEFKWFFLTKVDEKYWQTLFRVKNYDVFHYLRLKCLSQKANKKRKNSKPKKEVFHKKKHLNQKKSFIWKKNSFIISEEPRFETSEHDGGDHLSGKSLLVFLLKFIFGFFLSLYLSLQIFLVKKIDQKREEKTFIGNICKSEKIPPPPSRLFPPPPSSKQFSFFSADNTKLKKELSRL